MKDNIEEYVVITLKHFNKIHATFLAIGLTSHDDQLTSLCMKTILEVLCPYCPSANVCEVREEYEMGKEVQDLSQGRA